MENNIQTPSGDALPPLKEAPDTAPRKKTMTEAAIAANRANAKKSTGPRTAAGKLKVASNAYAHGLYSLMNFKNFCHDHDFTLEVVTNIYEQFDPLTPTEHMLTEQLIHLHLRFLQMETYYNLIMAANPLDTIANPPKMLGIIIRELNSLPGRISRQIKAIHADQLRRTEQARIAEDKTEEKFELEFIEDQPLLPVPPVDQTPSTENEAEVTYKPSELLYQLFAKYISRGSPAPQNEAKVEPAPDQPIPEN